MILWEQILANKKRYLTSAGAFIAGCVVLIVYSQTGPSSETYLDAELAYEKWATSPDDANLFRDMQQALKKVPMLETKYDAIIAQTLLDRAKDPKEAERAIAFAIKPLSRIQQEAPFHAAYAENSLNIELGAYQEALQKAVFLKEQMDKSCNVERFK